MYQPVVVEKLRSAVGYNARWVFCSIECARRHGGEPTRMCLPDEYDEVCTGCGYDPSLEVEDA